MPLNIPMGGGDGTAYIRFKPTENAWFMSGPDGPQEFEFTSDVLIDIENVQLGWLHLGVGIREWEDWPDNKQTKKPDEGEFKAGAKLKLFSKKVFGDDDPVRELCTNQAGVIEFIKELYADAESKFQKEKVPVVEMTGSKPVKIGKGSTRIPQYTINKFVDRPDELVFTNGHDVGSTEQQDSANADDGKDEF